MAAAARSGEDLSLRDEEAGTAQLLRRAAIGGTETARAEAMATGDGSGGTGAEGRERLLWCWMERRL